ncbi:ECF-type sigma factor [Adhaeretor mobilis]|uniref:ECF sigma factor n=1 Tax=Adhaeretor mobilis TaxID=1930276 RepID=A0A517MQB6_9BACT|nr:ECF-type sigma factor [Adhaeretor mobilis]QDS97076.1 ECF sigma factor [Adhaeretor mobilis]
MNDDIASAGKPERNSPEPSSEEWAALMHRLAQQAERSLRWMRKGIVSTEDTVMSTLRTYLRQTKEGELPPTDDPDSLWPILEKQLNRKIDKARASQQYKKNKLALRYSEMPLLTDGRSAETAFFDKSASPEQVEAYVAEALGLLKDSIKDDELLKIARLKLEGYTPAEIVKATGLGEHKVRRRLLKIRSALSKGDVIDE